MNIESNIKKSITKCDIILIIFLILVCALWFSVSLFSGGEQLKAEIYCEGEIVQSVKLSDIDEAYTLNVNGCEIYLSNEGVCFLQSECEDGLCVKRGALTKNGDSMACVPMKVVVSITATKDNEEFHAVAY